LKLRSEERTLISAKAALIAFSKTGKVDFAEAPADVVKEEKSLPET